MSEYWKSVPRKFCEFCKCWITDNKPSVEFHERGKRHQENVQLRLKEVRKKSLKDSAEQEEMDKAMEKMEKAALEAFKKDLKENPALAAQYGVSLEQKPSAKSETKDNESKDKSGETSKAKKRKIPEVKEWYEAVSPEGYHYYWSTVTGESVWEAPEDFVSLADQEKLASVSKQESGEKTEGAEDKDATSSKETETAATSSRVDPCFSRSAYGAWEVVKEESQPTVYDESSAPPDLEDIPLPDIPTVKETKPEKPKFKEKTVTSLGSGQSGPVAFKKRKIASGARNVRQKGNDD
ncbi:WW domain-binding protein 4 [Aplysia californica]|uniref:WW domain-binding protein 4 n=1 Tax=Aplysia californica TaxID=6500 RepID=A0ABM0JGW0_APLCA|nr:WW domain-binding protein 4 [Aplysia californica]